MKQLSMCLTLCALLMLGGCGQQEQETEKTMEPSSQSESTEKNTTPSEANHPASEEAGQTWPTVVPPDIPELNGVAIDGVYPQNANEKEYIINFSAVKEDESIMLAYIQLLTDSGFVQKYKTDNNFGFDYFGSNEKYDIFINLVYGNVSKLSVTVK